MSTYLATLWLAGTAVAETVHGVVVFSRHGDRTTKWYGSQALTSLGAEQNFQVGSSYRSRYLSSDSEHQILGVSEDEYVGSQVWASAPDQGILQSTATSFLQGLYPPLADLDEDLATSTLNNGSDSTGPLDGYQYVLLHGVADNSPDTIWIKGDDACPAYAESSKSFEDSTVFAERDEATSDFYAKFYDVLSPDVYNLQRDDLSYANAYNIFDLVNVARIHNESSDARDISDDDLLQLRTLADSSEHGLSWNASEPQRSIGAQTLSGAVLSQLGETVASEGQLKFSLLAGSYDTFLAFFGLAGLLDVSTDFYGLPDYASTMAFELFTDDNVTEFPSDEDDLRVRWLFRNGTEGDLTNFPLFGTDGDSLSWSRFVSEMRDRAITDVGDWCNECSAKEDFCAAYNTDAESSSSEDDSNSTGGGGLSLAAAGGIGAGVALAVVGVIGAIVFLVLKRKKGVQGAGKADESSIHSDSTGAAKA